jgi:hypothetical protein
MGETIEIWVAKLERWVESYSREMGGKIERWVDS